MGEKIDILDDFVPRVRTLEIELRNSCECIESMDRLV